MKKIVCLIAAILLLAQSAYAKDASDYPQKFWDVSKDHWAFAYIADLADRGVINGYEDGSFKPSKTVTRAEWSKIMVDAAGVQVSDNNVYFTDMANHWANKYVNAAKNYLTGYTDGSYRPNQAATREDVTVAMVRLKGYDLSEVDYSNLSKFTDVDSISNSAKGYVSVAIQNNLISGFEDNTFRGQDTLTRAEAATLLYRAFQHGNADKTVTAPTEPIKNDNSGQNTSVSDRSDKENEYVQQAQPDKDTTNNDEPEKEIKPYKVETLAKLADAHEEIYFSDFAAQIGDTIYYIDENGLYKLDTLSGKSKSCAKNGDSVDYNDETYTIDEFIKVFYDNSADRVLVSCVINNQDDFGYNSSECVLIDASDNSFVSDKTYAVTITDYPVIYVEDENIWTEYRGYTIDEGVSDDINDVEKTWYSGDDIGYVFGSFEKNGKLYLMSDSGVYAYDFNNMKQIIKCEGLSIGVNDNGFYIKTDNNSFVHMNFSGKKDSEILSDDIEIMDRKPIKFQSDKMYVDSNDEIIFFDNENSVFRKISKNTEE